MFNCDLLIMPAAGVVFGISCFFVFVFGFLVLHYQSWTGNSVIQSRVSEFLHTTLVGIPISEMS